MKINLTIAGALAALAIAPAFAQDAAPAQGQKKLEGAAWFGGLLPRQPKGVVAYCDYQTRIPEKDIMSFFVSTKGCPIILAYEHRRMEGKFDVAKAAAAMGKANAAIFIIDDPALPMSLISLEEKWGLVNVAKLAADNPKTLVLLRRAEKIVTRVATAVLGGCYDLPTPFSALKPVYSVSDLDRVQGFAIAPYNLTSINATLPLLGLTEGGMTTYQTACIEGWAPAPTNDVQREIWKDVKNPANRFKKDLPELTK